MTAKYRCIKSYYWNMTKPYFRFEDGKIYDVSGDNNSGYHFPKYCDCIMSPGSFCCYFISVERWREEKIDQILH